MGARRFFVDGIYAAGERVALASGDARKVTLVLRLHDGDALEICDSSGRAFDARLRLDGPRGFAELLEELAAPPQPTLEIVLAQALPKGQKMDYTVEKATELGVARIVPLITERSLESAPEAKLDRWRRIARTAAQQSGRSDVPTVEVATHWSEFCASLARERADAHDRENARKTVALVPWELADPIPLHDTLPALLRGMRRVIVAIGPEGGLGHEEAELARASGAHLISLGRRILRTETAGLVVCGILRYATGDL